MRKFILSLVALLSIGLTYSFANYAMTQGSGTTFGSSLVGGVHYVQMFICDLTTPGQCASVSSGGAIKVDASGATQPVSGTVTANAGTNLNTSALALETGGNLATTVTNTGTTNTNLGALGSTACATDNGSCNLNALLQRNNQRITSMITALGSPMQAGGSIGNTSFGISGTLPAYAATPTFNVGTAGTLALAANQTNASQKTQIVDGSGNVIASTSNALNVNVTNGASGGTSSSFAAAFPSTGTAVGMTQGGNMVALSGTSGNLNVQCANCSGSGVSTADQATFTAGSSLFAGTGGFFQTTATSNPLTNGQQGMAQMTAQRALFSNLRNASGTEVGTSAAELFVGGRGTAGTATGGVLTVQGVASMTPFLVNPGTAANWGVVAQGSTTSGQVGILNQAAVLTAAPTYTTAQTAPLTMDTAGALRVNVTTATGIAQGSTTSGQSGSLVMGAVTTAAPTYTTAQTSPISLDTAGNVRVNTGTVTVTATNLSVNNAQINGVTPLMGNGVTGTGSQRVTVASDSAARAVAGEGAIAAAVPSGAQLTGVRSGANMVELIQASASAAINVSTATTTQLVALSGSTKVYVTSFDVIAGGTGNITFVYGTGTNCGTGTTSLTGAYNLTAQAGISKGNGLGPVLVVPAGNALCITTSAAVQMSGSVSYTQF